LNGSLLDEIGVFQGISLEVEKYVPVVTSSSRLVYLNRSDAEHNKRYKQLIPYVLLISGGKILRYRRGRAARKHGCTDCIPLESGGTFRRRIMDCFRPALAITRVCGGN